eukprot:TRINITY_DN7624_c0_g1_i2.p1 TRINITY_DN7624_c0_g1~~TRINITY_DN7624_c0_g1_i2.p1  ORF type:complete len:154 (-),score=39.56 TRINITY_DN7624_c0_g1_i2:991-1452(-)
MDELQRSGALKHIKERAVSKTLTLDDDDEEEEGEVVLKLRDLLSEEMARARAVSSSSTCTSSSCCCKGVWFRDELRWSWRWKASLVNRSVISDSSVVMRERERERNAREERRRVRARGSSQQSAQKALSDFSIGDLNNKRHLNGSIVISTDLI